jgi:hypothetical protein
MSEGFAFRLANEGDAEDFAKWVAENPLTDRRDAISAIKNPTTLFFVVTKDDVPVAFVPFYQSITIAHLGFNPAMDGKDRLRALEMLLKAVAGFAEVINVREINTLSKTEYPMAAWALKHGFEKDDRELFRYAVAARE